MRRAEAEMRAETERDVRIRFPIQPYFLRRIEDGLVVVRRGDRECNPLARLYRYAVHLRRVRADARDVRDGRDDAEEFLAGVNDAARVGPQEIQVLRVVCK